jgi:hypothetical protein
VKSHKKKPQLNKKWMDEVGLLLSFGCICVGNISSTSHDMGE